MPDFHEVRFPDSISKGSSGGPRRRTDIVTLRSGFEERNSVWADSRREYDAGLGIRDINDMHEVLEFFEARLGRLYGFRWKDWADYKSCPPRQAISATDQYIGTPSAAGQILALRKVYSSGSHEYSRRIGKIVPGTLLVSYNGVDVSDNVLVDYDSGLFCLLVPHVPGAEVYAGFEFDVPVRFSEDHIDISVEQFNAGSLPKLTVIEIKVTLEPSEELQDIAELLEFSEVAPISDWLNMANRVDLAVNTQWTEAI